MTTETESIGSTPKSETILIVDDTPDNITVLSGVLRQNGYNVRAVRSGRDALRTAMRGAPDLVLLDVLMPEMNGYEVSEQFKANETLKDIPIIFISAATDTEVKVKAFSSGGVDFISKPFEAAELLARVHTHLALRSVKKELQRRLGEHEQRYKAMFDHCQVPELLIDPIDGQILDANPAAETFYGWPKARLTAMRISEIVVPRDDKADTVSECPGASSGRNDFDLRHRLASGEIRDVEVYSGPVVVNNRPLAFSIIHDATERRRAQALLERNRELLDCISRMQSRFIGVHDAKAAFEAVLGDILVLTGSRYGFFAELVEKPDGSRYQRVLAIASTCVVRNEEFWRYYEHYASSGLNLCSFDRLYAAAIVTQAPVVANDPPHHPFSRGIPADHPPLDNFLGLPLCHGDAVIGSVGLANREGGYDTETVTFIQPAIAAAAQILDAHREQQRRLYAVNRLAESESRYRSLVDTQIDLIVRFSPEGLITFVNDTVCTKLELSNSELVGQFWTCLVDPHDQSDMADCLEAACVYHAYSGVVEARFQGSGGRRWYSWEVSAVLGADQALVEIQAIGRDITEAKARENELIERKVQLNFVLSGSELGFWDWNLETGEVQRNPRWAEMLGYTFEEIEFTVKQWVDFVHPDDRDRALQSVTDHLEGLTPQHKIEYRMQTKDGGYRWILDQAKVVTTAPDGRPLRMSGTHTDITDAKQAEQALSESDERFNLFMAALPAAAFIKDELGTVIFANQYLADMVGTSDLCGKSTQDIFPPELAEAMIADDRRALETGSLVTEEYVPSSNGQQKCFETHKFSIQRHGRSPLLGGVALDISARKAAEAELIQAKLNAEAASRAKSSFLAMMSHEVRTPLTGVIGMADILSDTPLNEDQRSYIDTMRSSAKTLLTVLNDILDYSKIEADRLNVAVTTFDVVKLAAEMVRLFHSMAAENANSLTLDTGGIETLTVKGDAIRIKQVLGNLIGNAVKFTRNGTIMIRLQHQNKNDCITLMFDVEDSGIGISKTDMNRLFLPFSQLDTGTTRRFGGTGLGLAISKRLAELMGGDIGVTSQLGQGTCFHFTCLVERGTSEASGVEPHTAITIRPMAILLAEDNSINRMIVKIGLEQRGHHVTAVVNGKQACEAAAHERFDLILMDIQMPEMGGVEATRHIRALPQPFSDVPIVALTADALPEHRATYMEAGLTDFLTKPVEWSEINAVLARLDQGSSGSPSFSAGTEWAENEGDLGPLFDRERLLALRTAMSEHIFDEMIQDFILSGEDEASTLKQAIEQSNITLVHDIAHAIKGMFGNIGGTRVAELARKLQSSNDIDGASHITTDLIVAIRESIIYLRQIDFRTSSDKGERQSPSSVREGYPG